MQALAFSFSIKPDEQVMPMVFPFFKYGGIIVVIFNQI
jgi:hypothetical protein